jgi:hypothetical protein
MLPKVFRVLSALDPKGYQYQKPLLEQMLILKYHELHRTPTWYLLQNHFHLFNEEVGEISLSVLSRLQKPVLNKKPDVEHWDQQYRLSKVYQSVDDSVNKKSRDRSSIRSKPIKISKHAETIQRTQVFLEKLVRSAGRGTFSMLSGPKKTWDSKRYKGNKWEKERSVGRPNTIPMFQTDISVLLESRWRLVVQDTGSDWAAKYMAASWPEYDQGLDVVQGSDDEQNDEEEEVDASEALMDNANEGDDDGEFLLPSPADESEASEAGEVFAAIREHEEYMAEFVDVNQRIVEREGEDPSSPGENSNDEALLALVALEKRRAEEKGWKRKRC